MVIKQQPHRLLDMQEPKLGPWGGHYPFNPSTVSELGTLMPEKGI